jgi:cytochrome c oxidase cbb3-type subunit 3
VIRQRSLWVAALLATTAFGACDSMPGRPRRGSEVVSPDRVTDFAVLYAENCAACHGQNGEGGAGAIGLADPVYLAIVDDATLRRVTAAGMSATLMPAFSRSSGGMLTDAQVEILVRGIRAWERPASLGGASPPPYAGGAGDATRGGGPKAGSIVDGSFLGLVSDQGLRTTIIAGRPDIGQPDWRKDVPGRPMNGQEVSDVVAWLAARRPATPGRPYAGRIE